MTPDMWWLLGCAAAVLTAIGLACRWLARQARRERAVLTALVDATREPPAPGEAGAPVPDPPRVPGHHHGGVTYTVARYRCGCVHTFDGAGRLTGAFPCREQTDLDRWEHEMEDTP